MYNRYVPQPDGSFRRDRVDRTPPCPQPPPPKPEPCPPPCPPPEKPKKCNEHTSAGSFLKNLLPVGLDTGDLIVILLLLLLAGDCEENRSQALLTMVLYLFM